jgi:hypothetical protein
VGVRLVRLVVNCGLSIVTLIRSPRVAMLNQ